jgi:hypothetical protein
MKTPTFKELGRCLVRTDFPSGPEGWAAWCDHRIAKFTAAAESALASVAMYQKIRAGEHLVEVEAKLKELAKLTAKAKALEAQVQG